ncbi:MucR family transcriptional regulator [Gordonia alkaliphila]|uniref:ROS/MUCR transcriptional regulator protein n=1 Tax=Gordonia alkaliphila TaxID=1053547 RepID=A0ABP8ZKE2_9ACTN
MPTESVRGILATDGERVQCHECGGWYRSLSSHLPVHDLTSEQYRYEWDLPATIPLAADAHRNLARANALQRIDQAGEMELPRFVAATYPDRGPVGAEYEVLAEELWSRRLADAGWSSWQAAVDWAIEHDKGWADIARKLDITHQQARAVGLADGVVLPPLWQRRARAAAEHAERHGSLLNTRGALSSWLTQLRYEKAAGKLPRRAVAELDRLDPDWSLDRSARSAAARERNIARGKQLSSFEDMAARSRAAGFIDPTDLLAHGIVEHLTSTELAELVHIRGDTLLKRISVANPRDPFAATAHLRTSAAGILADDGRRVQCHECGLWFGSLTRHLTGHVDDDGDRLTEDGYRTRHGLPADLSLRSRGNVRRAKDDLWGPRLAQAGYASWEEAIIAAAAEHFGLAELGEQLGVRSDALPTVIAKSISGDPWAANKPYRLSRPGVLARDGDYSQCHECGLWFRRITKHIPSHMVDGRKLTVQAYRERHGLSDGLWAAATARPTDREPKDLWTERLAAHGYGSWEDALADLAAQHLNLRDFAARVGVKDSAVMTELLRMRPDDTWAPTAPFRLSRFGSLSDDGDRSQCHECGLWFASLGRHAPAHRTEDGSRLSWAQYQERHGITRPANWRRT